MAFKASGRSRVGNGKEVVCDNKAWTSFQSPGCHPSAVLCRQREALRVVRMTPAPHTSISKPEQREGSAASKERNTSKAQGKAYRACVRTVGGSSLKRSESMDSSLRHPRHGSRNSASYEASQICRRGTRARRDSVNVRAGRRATHGRHERERCQQERTRNSRSAAKGDEAELEAAPEPGAAAAVPPPDLASPRDAATPAPASVLGAAAPAPAPAPAAEAAAAASVCETRAAAARWKCCAACAMCADARMKVPNCEDAPSTG